MTFKDLNIHNDLLKVLQDSGLTQPTSIQEKAIQPIMDGKDVLGIAQTGSGKTISYVLPILMNLSKNQKTVNRRINVLVVVPTRELAVQVNEVFTTYSAALPQRIKSLAVYGGVSINPQMIALQNVNILIATPGRLLELVDSNAVHLSGIQTLVLDEADKMLNLGFKKEMSRILELLPLKRQNLLFSATLTDDINNLHQLVLHSPLIIKIEQESDTIDLINQSAYMVSEEKKGPLLRHLIKQKEMKQVLIFTSSVYAADNVADKLRKNGIEASAIHSKKSQGARTEALANFKSGKITALVATDLISRGIDIKFLPFVINYELPRSPKDYIHRIGRTGRAESPGEAISLLVADDEHHFKIIQKKMKKSVTIIDSSAIL